jgi:tRNA A-37 threonylcarbamoyl transferase component Bud32
MLKEKSIYNNYSIYKSTMTTTSHFQKKPDYYSTTSECQQGTRRKIITNPRYGQFKQTHFTAGDNDQFQRYRDRSNGDICNKKIKLEDNKFYNTDLSDDLLWSKYEKLNATCVDNTFNYMFNKFKKGIFVKIQDNKLKVFLPFSKKGFINDWGDKIKIDPKYGTMYNFVTHINKMTGKNYKVRVNEFTDTWYANNCLLRYEDPINEGDTNVPNVSNMLLDLCANRIVPDMEFFINRRDFPIINKNGTEAYDHIFGDDHPLLSHDYDKFSPILSMVTSDEHADVPMPTGDDWARIGSYEGKIFGNECRTYPLPEHFKTKWKNKKPTAMFRGASTGCGVTIETNIRLKLAYISVTTPPDVDGPLLDAGISKWQTRPRKLKNEKYLQTINIPYMNKLGIQLASFLSPIQQSEYKYLIHVDGHVSSFRLSLEMSMGCCILLADSKYRLWFRSMMKPMVHYIPVKEDLSNLIEKIKWCRTHDNECKKIAKNAKKFYLQYLQKDGALDYLQKIIIDMKKQSGIYLYNTETPLQRQIRLETPLDLTYPLTDKTIANIGNIPRQARSIGILKGMEWIINMVNKESIFTDVAKKGNIVSINNAETVIVQKYSLAGFTFIIKKSIDIIKQQENIHEAYIGTKVINEIVKYIPNFAYVFGKFDGETKNIVIMENIHGKTFDEWLQSDKFNIQDYIFILIQLSMALEVAQNQSGFVHYDLTPWNIIMQEIPNPITFDYMLDGTNVFRVSTKLIPVIIDYGKSHVIHENEHHGYINMYKMSTIQDIISILLTSLNIVIKLDLSKEDLSDVVKLANFMSGTGYRKDIFTSTVNGLSDVKKFISRAKKYTEMISSDKHELELKTPRDFIDYVNDVFKYNFSYEKIDSPTFRINRGNPRQVFEYVLASSQEEKTQSYIDVFNRVIECDLPEPMNLFFSYYTAQTLEENITSVYKLMLLYLEAENLQNSSKKYKKAMKKIKTSYGKFNEKSHEKIEYDISRSFRSLAISEYTEETFLVPSVILTLLSKHKNTNTRDDLSEYKNMIEHVFLNQGMFKMSDEHKEYYSENFSELLSISSVNMKTYSANIHTLQNVSKGIYKKDKHMLTKNLQTKIKQRKCESVDEYMVIYGKIQESIKKSKKVKKVIKK